MHLTLWWLIFLLDIYRSEALPWSIIQSFQGLLCLMQILKAAFPDYMILFSTLTIQYCQRQEMPRSKTLSWPSLTPFGIHRIYSLSICCRHFLTQFKITHHLRFTKAKPSKMFFISDSCPICFGYVVKKIPGPQYLRYISIFATKKYI